MSIANPNQKPGLSIRTTLILLLTAFTTALLIVVYAATTWQYSTDQLNQIDQFLIRETDNIHHEITQPLQTKGIKTIDQMDSPDYVNFVKAYIARRLNMPIQFKSTLAITNNDNVLVAESNQALELDLRELLASHASLSDQKSLGENSFVVTVRNASLTYRLMYYPIIIAKQQMGSIRFACLLDTAINSSMDFAGSTALFLALAILLNISGSIILVIRILTPVQQMSEAVERISEQNIAQRLPILPGKDELSNLSITFNRALDRIANAWRFQEDLVNDMSHQLRTPLTTLRSSMELALRRSRSAEEYRRIIEDSLSDIDRLGSLVNTMLTVARLEGTQSVLKPEPLEPIKLLREICEEMMPLWDDKKLKVRIHNELPGSFKAMLDKLYLTQALINILDNARKYSPPNSVIQINILPGVPGKELLWLLQIINNGPNIPEESLERIFERFYRVDNTQDSNSNGFGLGLNIASRIVHLHNGSITARNRPEGGVIFELILPGRVN